MYPKDEFVVIQQGELLSGIVAKKIVGNVHGGLIHIIWKDLGPQACCDIISNIQLVVNNWLVNTGFTIGV
jgi:DNA-directed RNA polymerase II subunit RPB1